MSTDRDYYYLQPMGVRGSSGSWCLQIGIEFGAITSIQENDDWKEFFEIASFTWVVKQMVFRYYFLKWF